MKTSNAPPGDDWVERVRAASDLVEIVTQTVPLKRVGRNWMGLCPFHGEKTPSFSVHPERQFYHCFSCKAGGDVFKFIQETEKIGFLEAVERLSRRAGIPVPERGAPGGSTRGPLLAALGAAAEAYEQWLADPGSGAGAKGYLERRGISREAQRAFRLGVAPPGWDPLVRRLEGRFPDEVLISAGLASRRERGGSGIFDRFRNRLMVPLIQAGGDVVGFGARALAPADEPKYLNSPETAVYHKGSFLFALEQARRNIEPAGEAIVVEGYFDAIALHQAGLTNTVATSGTALTPDHARALRRMTSRVALTYDGDAAGRDAVARSLGVLLQDGLEVVVVDLPATEDPDTLVRRGGIAAWNEVRSRAADPIEFFERHVLRAKGQGDPRERAIQAVVGLATKVADPVRRRLLLERASQVFGMTVEVLDRAVRLKASGQVSERPVASAMRVAREAERGIEGSLLRALLNDPEALVLTSGRIEVEDFQDPACRELARWIWAGGLGTPEDDGAAVLMRDLASSPAEYHWREEARGAVAKMMIRRLKRRRKDVQEELRRAASEPEQRTLLEQTRDLSREIEDVERSLRDFAV